MFARSVSDWVSVSCWDNVSSLNYKERMNQYASFGQDVQIKDPLWLTSPLNEARGPASQEIDDLGEPDEGLRASFGPPL